MGVGNSAQQQLCDRGCPPLSSVTKPQAAKLGSAGVSPPGAQLSSKERLRVLLREDAACVTESSGPGLEPPRRLSPGDKTAFCCSRVELEYLEVYFLYEIMGSLTY